MNDYEDLDAEELGKLSSKTLDLIALIREITDEDSEKGRQLSRPEQRRLLRAVTGLGAQLAIDILD